MSASRTEQIGKRRAQIPRSYRAIYDKAASGRSLRAAINSFCLECCHFQIEEIRNCTDLGCALFAARPYQRSPQNGHDGCSGRAESPSDRGRDNDGR